MYLDKLKDRQYRRPSGIVGRVIGRSMALQHIPENEWTVSLIDPRPDDAVLEIGFGPGLAVELLARKISAGRVCGVDLSRTMVKVASKRNAEAIRDGRVELRHGDATNLPFADDSFDKALSVHSVYFWPEPQRVLGEVRRVLRPGGLLVLTLLPGERMHDPETTPEFKPYSGEELASMMDDSGYVDCRVMRDDDPGLRSNYTVLGYKDCRTHLGRADV